MFQSCLIPIQVFKELDMFCKLKYYLSLLRISTSALSDYTKKVIYSVNKKIKTCVHGLSFSFQNILKNLQWFKSSYNNVKVSIASFGPNFKYLYLFFVCSFTVSINYGIAKTPPKTTKEVHWKKFHLDKQIILSHSLWKVENNEH